MATHEEVLGLIQGIAAVVRDQQAAQKDVTLQTQQQIQHLSQAVTDLSQSVRLKEASAHSPLRLPQLTLPEFTGGEQVDKFIEQLTQVLSSSGVAAKFWLTYLKQQCQKDSRAFDIICSFELANASKISHKTTNDEFLELYDRCCDTLHKQRGIPKDQQIRHLLATYYAMAQQPTETVSNFAHRFLETQHALEKLIPGIHTSHDGNQMELIHAFSMKLKPVIAKELLSRDTPFQSITAVIEAAKRHEAVCSHSEVLSTWPTSANAMYSVTPVSCHQGMKVSTSEEKGFTNSHEICRKYNKYFKSFCELPDHKCKRGYLHKCSSCNKYECKACKCSQKKQGTQNFQGNGKSFTRKAGNQHSSQTASANIVDPAQESQSVLLSSVKQVVHESLSTLKQELTTSIKREVEKRIPPPQATPSASAESSQDQIFGMPATTPLTPISQVLDMDLANKNILWTKITSAGVSLPLPLDSCCSVSLVSQKHAETVAKSHPNLKFTRLEQHIPVSVAGPSSNLRAVGTMQVPIVWENGRKVTFTMLVVPQLSWPILFGQNHLRLTDARISSRELKVYFADRTMDFQISCYDSNPLQAFPTLRNPKSSPDSSANVTCLLTAMPSSCEPGGCVSFARGFNLVTVCFLVTASLVGSPLFSGPLWLEGNQFSPGLETLSGPIDFQSIQNIVFPGDIPPSFLTFSLPAHSKCRTSRPVPQVDKYCVAILASQSEKVLEEAIHNEVYIATVLIRSTKGSAKLPGNISLGTLRSVTTADTDTFQNAANHTAQLLSDKWYSNIASMNGSYLSYITIPGATPPGNGTTLHSHDTENKAALVSLPTNVIASALDSSLLSQFLDHDNSVHEHAFPPTAIANCDPSSEQYFNELVNALELNMPAYAHVPADHYAQHLITNMKDAHSEFSAIKADLRRRQRELYDIAARNIEIPDGKIVYIRKDHGKSTDGKVTRFIRNFDGPYEVIGHPYNRSDLLTVRNLVTGELTPRPVNIEKVVVVPDHQPGDLRIPDEAILEPLPDQQIRQTANPDLATVAMEFGKYLQSLPNKSAVSSQACKYVYEHFLASREILARHGKLKGLVKSCPYLQMDGSIQGGTYLLSLNQDVFEDLKRST